MRNDSDVDIRNWRNFEEPTTSEADDALQGRMNKSLTDITLGRLTKLRHRPDDHVLTTALNSNYGARLFAALKNQLQNYSVGNEQAAYGKNRLSIFASRSGLLEHCKNPSSDYVSAIQLRTNSLSTTGSLHNVRALPQDQLCYGGCQRYDTLSHVLRRCPVTQHPRIARLDHAVRKIARACTTKGYIAETEPRIRDSEGRLHKPDLLVKKDDQIHLIEVGVNWETPRPLAEHRINKTATYLTPNFIKALQLRHPGCTINIGITRHLMSLEWHCTSSSYV